MPRYFLLQERAELSSSRQLRLHFVNDLSGRDSEVKFRKLRGSTRFRPILSREPSGCPSGSIGWIAKGQNGRRTFFRNGEEHGEGEDVGESNVTVDGAMRKRERA